MRRTWPKATSGRAIRNLDAFRRMSVTGEVPVMEAPRKRGRQLEGIVNDAIGEWCGVKPGLFLKRNKRRLAVPVGYDKPIMLGWMAEGSLDWVGDYSLTITPAMVGKRIAVATYIEAKTRDGVVRDEQQRFMDRARDAGAIVGVARDAQEADDLVAAYVRRLIGDER